MSETLSAIAAIIDEAERMKKAYFFPPLRTARERRAYENKHTHAEVSWADGDVVYTAAFDVTCTCGHIYAKGRYTRNGNKTTLTAIRNSYNRIKNSPLNFD